MIMIHSTMCTLHVHIVYSNGILIIIAAALTYRITQVAASGMAGEER